ncbi:kallikrein-8-like [Suncus etruscus]|uniref:kallikrein-8-like n=1 Tax=Suncus etruscus TaxID=109475 RepID=UPI00210FAAF4|nr:kallikrein-8-like [Suncus etruscus]
MNQVQITPAIGCTVSHAPLWACPGFDIRREAEKVQIALGSPGGGWCPGRAGLSGGIGCEKGTQGVPDRLRSPRAEPSNPCGSEVWLRHRDCSKSPGFGLGWARRPQGPGKPGHGASQTCLPRSLRSPGPTGGPDSAMGHPPLAAACTPTFLFLLLWSPEACAGQWRAQGSKVLEGQECRPFSQPWQAALFQGISLLCGGVLVGQNWVVTAAHCQKPKYTVRLGDHSLKNREGSEQEMEVAQSIPHPCYNRSSDDNSHDIMLIRLRGRVNFGPKVKPIKLPDYCPKAGQKCEISGWGTVTSPEENFPDTLNCAQVEIYPQKQCKDAYPGKVTDSMVCAGDSNGADTCQGDSGGPLVCDNRLQGITSWGSDPCGKPEKPGVYTNVCYYLQWLKKTMGNRD